MERIDIVAAGETEVIEKYGYNEEEMAIQNDAIRSLMEDTNEKLKKAFKYGFLIGEKYAYSTCIDC